MLFLCWALFCWFDWMRALVTTIQSDEEEVFWIKLSFSFVFFTDSKCVSIMRNRFRRLMFELLLFWADFIQLIDLIWWLNLALPGDRSISISIVWRRMSSWANLVFGWNKCEVETNGSARENSYAKDILLFVKHLLGDCERNWELYSNCYVTFQYRVSSLKISRPHKTSEIVTECYEIHLEIW